MKMLDLKKLMLVPLVSCVSVQQTDAEVQKDSDAEKVLKKSQNFRFYSKKLSRNRNETNVPQCSQCRLENESS